MIKEKQMKDFFEGKGPIVKEKENYECHPTDLEKYGFSIESPISRTFCEFLKKCKYLEGYGHCSYEDPYDEDTLVDYDVKCSWWVGLISPNGIPFRVNLEFYHYPTHWYIPVSELPSDEEIKKAALTGKLESITSSLQKARRVEKPENYEYKLEVENLEKHKEKILDKKSTVGFWGKVCVAIYYNSRKGYETLPTIVKELYEGGQIVTVEQVEKLIVKMKELEEKVEREKREILNKIFQR
jgi:hypothetical protein